MDKKQYEIVFDLDGVLRDLSGEVSRRMKCPLADNWEFRYKGLTIYEAVKKLKGEPLYKAPPLPYVFTVENYIFFKYPVKIWTVQPKEWRMDTLAWLEFNISKPKDVRFFDSFEEKENALRDNPNVILCDDCPNFSSYYKRTILIDALYNRDELLKSKDYLCRVTSDNQLREEMTKLYKET